MCCLWHVQWKLAGKDSLNLQFKRILKVFQVKVGDTKLLVRWFIKYKQIIKSLLQERFLIIFTDRRTLSKSFCFVKTIKSLNQYKTINPNFLCFWSFCYRFIVRFITEEPQLGSYNNLSDQINLKMGQWVKKWSNNACRYKTYLEHCAITCWLAKFTLTIEKSRKSKLTTLNGIDNKSPILKTHIGP